MESLESIEIYSYLIIQDSKHLNSSTLCARASIKHPSTLGMGRFNRGACHILDIRICHLIPSYSRTFQECQNNNLLDHTKYQHNNVLWHLELSWQSQLRRIKFKFLSTIQSNKKNKLTTNFLDRRHQMWYWNGEIIWFSWIIKPKRKWYPIKAISKDLNVVVSAKAKTW